MRDPDQNTTDLEKCLAHLIEFDHVVIIGGLGGNFTQTLSNLNALYLFPYKKISLVSDENVVCLLKPGYHKISCQVGTKVGLIPLGSKCDGINTKGLKWDIGTKFFPAKNFSFLSV